MEFYHTCAFTEGTRAPKVTGFFGTESQYSNIYSKFKPVLFFFLIFITKTGKMRLDKRLIAENEGQWCSGAG